jgi:hypothetical protein
MVIDRSGAQDATTKVHLLCDGYTNVVPCRPAAACKAAVIHGQEGIIVLVKAGAGAPEFPLHVPAAASKEYRKFINSVTLYD